MTGFGKAQLVQEGIAVSVEIKSVNHRYLAINGRVPDGYGSFGPKIESMIRAALKRGSIFYNLQIILQDVAGAFVPNRALALRYLEEIAALEKESGRPLSTDGAAILGLPGVLGESVLDADTSERLGAVIESAAKAALDELLDMRRREGESLGAELERIIASVEKLLGEIERGCEGLVDEYRKRLSARVNSLLADTEIRLAEEDLAREIAVYADRSDISEELVRVRSHVEQFRAAIGSPEPVGRRLEFLVQEMFREANTMGSKSVSPELSRLILALKGEVEKAKEQVLNVE